MCVCVHARCARVCVLCVVGGGVCARVWNVACVRYESGMGLVCVCVRAVCGRPRKACVVNTGGLRRGLGAVDNGNVANREGNTVFSLQQERKD